jgi:hypothetical protein
MKLEEHPTVRRLLQKSQEEQGVAGTLERDWLREMALDCGAHDVGFVELSRSALDPQRDEILRNYAWTKSLLSFVVRMAR